MAYPPWQRPRFNGSGGPSDEFLGPSAPPDPASAPGETGSASASLGWMLTRQVPEEAAPPGSTFFNAADSLGVAAVGSSLLPGTLFQLDADRYGVLKSLDLEVTDYTTLSNVQFTLLVNGTPAIGFSAIRIPPANAALKTRGFDMSLALPRGAQVQVSVNDVDGGSYVVNATFFGWQWPVAIDARYRPEGVGVR